MSDTKTEIKIEIVRCNDCLKELPLTKDNFYICKGKFKKTRCKPCKRIKTKLYYTKNKKKIIEYSKNYQKEYIKRPYVRERINKKNRAERALIKKLMKFKHLLTETQ